MSKLINFSDDFLLLSEFLLKSSCKETTLQDTFPLFSINSFENGYCNSITSDLHNVSAINDMKLLTNLHTANLYCLTKTHTNVFLSIIKCFLSDFSLLALLLQKVQQKLFYSFRNFMMSTHHRIQHVKSECLEDSIINKY